MKFGVADFWDESIFESLALLGFVKSVHPAIQQRPKKPPFQVSRTAIDQDKFVGRDSDLTQLDQQLYQSRTLAITAIEGMGGVGKTELALQYTYRVSASQMLLTTGF